MADQSDVIASIAATVSALLYPNGTTQASAVGAPCRIYGGWPTTDKISTDMAAGVVNVSIYPSDIEQNTTRYPAEWQFVSFNPTTVAATVSGMQVFLTGTISTPQNVGLLVNGKPYLYAIQANDTLATIATALAALVNADTPASASSATINIPGAHSIIFRAGSTGTSVKEVGRTNKQFQIVLWCPTWELRDAVSKAILPTLRDTEFVTMPDGTSARFLYVRNRQTDDGAKDNLYRRDVFYAVEYAETLTRTDTVVLVFTENIYGGLDKNGPLIETINF